MPQKYNFKQRYERLLDKIEKELAEEKLYDSLGDLVQDNKKLFDMCIKTTPEEMKILKENYESLDDEKSLNEEVQTYWKTLVSLSNRIAMEVEERPIQDHNISLELYISGTKNMLTHKISVEDKKVYIKQIDDIESRLRDLGAKLGKIYDIKIKFDKVKSEILAMVDVLGENYLGCERDMLRTDLRRYNNNLSDIEKIMFDEVMRFYDCKNKESVYVSALMDVLYFIFNHSIIPKNERKTLIYEREFKSADPKRKNEKVELPLEVKKYLSSSYQVKLEQYPDMKSKIEEGKSRKRKFKEFLEEQIKFNEGLEPMYIYMTEKHTCIEQSWRIYQITQNILDAKFDVQNEKDDETIIGKIGNIAKQISRCHNLYFRYHLIDALKNVISKKCYEPEVEINDVLYCVGIILEALVNDFNERYDEFCKILIYIFCDKSDYLCKVEKEKIDNFEKRSEELLNFNANLTKQRGRLQGEEKNFRNLIYANKGIYAQRYNAIWDNMEKGERDLLRC